MGSLGDGMDRVGGFGADGDAGMEKFGEDFDAGDQARTGSRKVGVGIHVEDLVVANRGHCLPLIRKSDGSILCARLIGVVAAGSDDQNFRLGGDDFFQRDAAGGRAHFSENVATAGKFNHLRDPVAADIDWLQPLKERDARAADGLRNFIFNGGEPCADGFKKALGLVATQGFIANPKDIAPDIAEVERIEGQNFRPAVEIGQHRAEIFWRSGADAAQILRDDEIRSETAEGIGVYRVDALSTFREFTDHAVNLARRNVFGDAGFYGDGFSSNGGRKVALMADAHNLIAEAKGEKNFSGGRDQGNDAQWRH